MTDYADWQSRPVPAGWNVLDQRRRTQLVKELTLELSNGHRLFGQVLSPVAGRSSTAFDGRDCRSVGERDRFRVLAAPQAAMGLTFIPRYDPDADRTTTAERPRFLVRSSVE